MLQEQTKLVSPHIAFFSITQTIPIFEAVSHIAASTIRVYPPGIPIIYPGIKYTKEIIEDLYNAHQKGAQIVGVDFNGNAHVEVVKHLSANTENTDVRKSIDSKFSVATYMTDQIGRHTGNEIADFFGAGFSAQPYFHFALHEDDPYTSLPPSLDFDLWSKTLSLKRSHKRSTQSILLHAAKNSARPWYTNEELNAISLPEGFYRWSDPMLCRKIIHDRFKDPGYITIVRNKLTGELRGILHARIATFKRLYKTEEWHDPCLFSHYKNKKMLDDPDRFYKALQTRTGCGADDKTVIISAQLLHPEAHGGQVFFELMSNFSHNVKNCHKSLPVVAEIPKEGTAYITNVASTENVFLDILANGHPFVFTRHLSNSLDTYIHGKTHWKKRLREEIRRQKEIKKQIRAA